MQLKATAAAFDMLFEVLEKEKAAPREAAQNKTYQTQDNTERKIEQATEALLFAYEKLKELGRTSVLFEPESPLEPVKVLIMPEAIKRVPGQETVGYRRWGTSTYLSKRKNVGMIVFQSAEPVGGGADES